MVGAARLERVVDQREGHGRIRRVSSLIDQQSVSAVGQPDVEHRRIGVLRRAGRAAIGAGAAVRHRIGAGARRIGADIHPAARIVAAIRAFAIVCDAGLEEIVEARFQVQAVVEQAFAGRQTSLDLMIVPPAGLAVLDRALEPLELGVEDEVDDAGDRIRTISGRRTTGHHVDTLDQRLRDDVRVGGADIAGRRQALAVEQQQRFDLAQGAKVEIVAGTRLARLAGCDVRAGGLEELRHGRKTGGETLRRLLQKFDRADHRHRRRRLIAVGDDARARDEDFARFVDLRGGSRRRRRSAGRHILPRYGRCRGAAAGRGRRDCRGGGRRTGGDGDGLAMRGTRRSQADAGQQQCTTRGVYRVHDGIPVPAAKPASIMNEYCIQDSAASRVLSAGKLLLKIARSRAD